MAQWRRRERSSATKEPVMAVKTVLKDKEVETSGKIPQFLSAGGYKAKAHSQKQLDRAALKSGSAKADVFFYGC